MCQGTLIWLSAICLRKRTLKSGGEEEGGGRGGEEEEEEYKRPGRAPAGRGNGGRKWGSKGSEAEATTGKVVIDIQHFRWRQRWQRGLRNGKQRTQPAVDAVFIGLHALRWRTDPQCRAHMLQRTASLTVSFSSSPPRCLFLFFI